jgi:hypothetical protein
MASHGSILLRVAKDFDKLVIVGSQVRNVEFAEDALALFHPIRHRAAAGRDEWFPLGIL